MTRKLNVKKSTKSAPAKAVKKAPVKKAAAATPKKAVKAQAPKPDRSVVQAARDQKSIDAFRTHYGQATTRDDAYLAFYFTIAEGKPFKLPAVAEKKVNPYWPTSNKASDVGAMNRARKAGNVVYNEKSGNYSFTPKGLEVAKQALKAVR